MNYYIYYRVSLPADEWVPRVREMHAALVGETAVQGSLLRQAGDTATTATTATWMEIYNDVQDAEQFETALHRLVLKHRLAEDLESGTQRHTERFLPI